MKKSTLQFAAAGLIATICSGCIVAPFEPPQGQIFTEIKAPLDINYDATKTSGLKKGTATSVSILGLIATGDNSTATAAKDGKISKIHYADYEYKNILGIIQETKVNVYGE